MFSHNSGIMQALSTSGSGLILLLIFFYTAYSLYSVWFRRSSERLPEDPHFNSVLILTLLYYMLLSPSLIKLSAA